MGILVAQAKDRDGVAKGAASPLRARIEQGRVAQVAVHHLDLGLPHGFGTASGFGQAPAGDGGDDAGLIQMIAASGIWIVAWAAAGLWASRIRAMSWS